MKRLKKMNFKKLALLSAALLGLSVASSAFAERYDYAKFQLAQGTDLPQGLFIENVSVYNVRAYSVGGEVSTLPAYDTFNGFPTRWFRVKFSSYGPLPGSAYTFTGTVTANINVQLSDGTILNCHKGGQSVLEEHFVRGILQQNDLTNIALIDTYGIFKKKVKCVIAGNPYKKT